MLCVSRKDSEEIVVTLPDGRVGIIKVVLVLIHPYRVRLGLDFPADVIIDRREVHDARLRGEPRP